MPPKALAYIGPPDARYIVLTIAAIKTGSKILFLSPRNSAEAQRSVIEQADCIIFLCSQSMDARVQKLLQSHPSLSEMAHFVVPEQEELLKDDFFPDFLYERTVEEARLELLVVLHTSRLLLLFPFGMIVMLITCLALQVYPKLFR
ncbi:hypothetical protein LTS15_000498 [Exophiala xenobiotica]|nr:hypothetical protein LTS15_000498 [Exophiala xenobiotica]